MDDFKLYIRYVARFGETFSESELSPRGWQAARKLMQNALETDGPPVTNKMIWAHLHSPQFPR